MRNQGQTKCLRCRRWHLACLDAGCITDDVWRELTDYAKANGHRWKSTLRNEWANGSLTLRWARNMFGPSGLDKVMPSACRFARRGVR